MFNRRWAQSYPQTTPRRMGRPVVRNAVAQYHVGRLFCPEIENNATFYHGGVNDGRVQTFLTPGLMFSKFKFQPDSRSRTALMFGGGMQIATSRFHTYNHAVSDDDADALLTEPVMMHGVLRFC